jgi:hypothetical protein
MISELYGQFQLYHFQAGHCEQKIQPPVRAPVQSTRRIQASPEKHFTKRYRVERLAAFDEIRDYYSLSRENFNTCDPVKWWFARKAQFPNLFCLLIYPLLSRLETSLYVNIAIFGNIA